MLYLLLKIRPFNLVRCRCVLSPPTHVDVEAVEVGVEAGLLFELQPVHGAHQTPPTPCSKCNN
jgi:hypothetical protein